MTTKRSQWLVEATMSGKVRRPVHGSCLVVAAGLLAFAMGGCGTARGAGLDASPVASATTTTKPVLHTIAGVFTIDDPWYGGKSVNDCVLDAGGDTASQQYRDCLGNSHARIEKLAAGKTIPMPHGIGGGFSDIQNGTQVTVTDASGTLLGTGTLKHGHADLNGIEWDFTIRQVPDTKWYQIEVGRRGAVDYTRAKIAKQNWNVAEKVPDDHA